MINFLKRHKKSLIFLVIILIAAGIAYYYLRHKKDNFITAKVTRGPIIEAVYGIGTVNTYRTYQLKVGVNSTIQQLNVLEGDFVKRGTKLLTLDGVREFFAPFDGTITALPFKVGEIVFPQVAILTLSDFNQRYLVVSVEQQGAIHIQPGQSVKLSFESLRDQVFSGKVEAVYSNVDRFLVRISANNLPKSILPGMTADVSITLQKRDNVLLVPVSAISNNKVQVLKGDSRKPQMITIKTGFIDGDMAEIVSGDLHVGDLVITNKGE